MIFHRNFIYWIVAFNYQEYNNNSFIYETQNLKVSKNKTRSKKQE